MALTPSTNQALLDAQLELWHTTFAYIKSRALKSALDLRIADAIHHNGGAATLPQIVARVTLHPSKTPFLRRLMRVLTATGVFTAQHPPPGSCEPMYALAPMSHLLVGSQSMVPFAALALHPTMVSNFFELGTWLQRDELPADAGIFQQTHGQTLWEMASRDATFDAMFNDAMASDSHFIMDIAIKGCGEVFQGISYLIDVAGGHGAAAQAISKAFPHVKCSVLDLGYVVAKAPTPNDDTNVQYFAGDMFERVPPANAEFLKSVLHDWGDEECVKILKNCRQAVPSRVVGGKIIIIDIVVEAGTSDSRNRETQALFDLCIMSINGIERDEQEWKKIFLEAGFSDYKITPVLGIRSIIEVYP